MIHNKIESFYEVKPLSLVERLTHSPPINYLNNFEHYWDDEQSFSHTHLLSDDHWKKFELDYPELSSIDDFMKDFNSDSYYDNLSKIDKNGVLINNNHDCMWAGHCGSREHSEERRSSFGCVIPKPPVIRIAEFARQPTTTTKIGNSNQQQQSLLKPSVKANNTTAITLPTCNNGSIVHTPQTPPESDDEENKTIVRLTPLDSDCDFEEDSDLCDYFKDEDVDVKEEIIDIKEELFDIKTEDETESEQDEVSYEEYHQYNQTRTQRAAENDHSYHKDMNADMILHNYGLDTPSESEEEEEIDVVSVNDKFGSAPNRMTLSLPNYPSDRHQLQQRMATAISRKHDGTAGLKTMLPASRCNTSSPYSGTISIATRPGRGVKRTRVPRANLGCKRRRFNGDGSVREHTDKRHLHNNMERLRRVDLRIAFDHLKSLVPEVSGTKKIAKVNILLQAAQYCYYLTGTNTSYTKQLDDLRKQQVYLRQRLSHLRKNLAARR